jgi:DNA-directed RNA polymerase specialized sigma24 family protein
MFIVASGILDSIMSVSDPGRKNDSADVDRHARSLFDSTPWIEVRAAGDSGHPSQRTALQSLCSAYWPVLHLYVRRKVKNVHLAQDLTQSFFERLLKGKSLKLADPARGRFRTFLIQAFEWHLANEFREGRAEKRGGKVKTFPLDFSSHDSWLADDETVTADQLFEREWAITLLNLTMERLRTEQSDAGKSEVFGVLKRFLTGEGPQGGYQAVCEQVALNEPAARMAVSRLRVRYRELLREEIAKTVASSQDVDDEIRHLFRAVSAKPGGNG